MSRYDQIQDDHYSNYDEEQPEETGLFHSFFLWLAGIGWLKACFRFVSVRWRAFKIQCARGWFHYHRGQQIRHQRDLQAKESSLLVKSAEKVKGAPAALYGLYQTDRAWLFTTITGTIGLILLLIWFYGFLTAKPEQGLIVEEKSPPDSKLGLVSLPNEPQVITDLPPDEETGATLIELEVRPEMVFFPVLDEENIVTAPLIPYEAEIASTLPDGWLPYQERPEEFIPEPVEEPTFEFEDSEPEDVYPKLTFDLDEPAEEVEESQEANIHIEKIFPENTSVGQAFRYVLLVTNMGSQLVAQTEVRETIEESFKVASTFPEAKREDRNLSWMLTNLEPGEKREILIDLYPTETGEKESVVTVRPQVAAKSATKVVHDPKLNLTVKQPKSARIGDWVPVIFEVTNVGNGPVSNIILKTELPAEVQHEKGESLSIRIPALEPGQSHQVKLAPRATMIGLADVHSSLVTAGFEKNLNHQTRIAPRLQEKNRPVSPRKTTSPSVPQPACYPVPVSEPVYYQPAMRPMWYLNPIRYW